MHLAEARDLGVDVVVAHAVGDEADAAYLGADLHHTASSPASAPGVHS